MTSGEITYSVERVADILDEIKPLLQEHWEEIALYKDQFPLDPDYDKYLSLDAAGAVHIVTARIDGVLIGYYISFVLPHMHYRDCLCAMNDILFLKKEYRRGRAGLTMIDFAEQDLKRNGINRMILQVNTAHDFGSLLERQGFYCVEKTYEKVLNGRAS